MSDDALNIAAIAVQFGSVVLLASLYFFYKRFRSHLAVVAGAVAPLIIFYISASFAYFTTGRNEELSYAFNAMWIMCFFGFVASFVIGIALSFMPRPKHNGTRFLSSAAIVSALGLATMAI